MEPFIPVTIYSTKYPDRQVATVYEDYHSKELRLAVFCSYLEGDELDKVAEAYKEYQKNYGPQ